MVRRAAQLAASLTALAACNALTGVGDLSEESGEALAVDAGSDAPVLPPPIPTPPATTTTTPPPPPPPPADSGAEDASPADAAPADTGPPDTFVPPPPCTPTATPVRYPLDVSSNNVGTPNWSERFGARAPNDNSRAHTNGDNPNTLSLRNFGFALPTDARILGILLEISRNTLGPTADDAISLSKGSSKSNGAWPQGPFDGPYVKTSYGSATDLWGTSWIAEDLNSAAFTVGVKTVGDGDGHLDAVGVIVHYCVPGQ